jgi:hypothetical protein
MLRALAAVSLSLVLYAGAIFLSTLLMCDTVQANPENGRTYRASLRLRSADLLEVKGCLLLVCDTQIWRRVESLCNASLTGHWADTAATASVAADFRH